jgi:hypothetical protein
MFADAFPQRCPWQLAAFLLTLARTPATAQCTQWLPSATDQPNGRIFALATMANGDLVAGGEFTAIGGIAANRIARWDGTAWHALGTGMNGNVLSIVTLHMR